MVKKVEYIQITEPISIGGKCTQPERKYAEKKETLCPDAHICGCYCCFIDKCEIHKLGNKIFICERDANDEHGIYQLFSYSYKEKPGYDIWNECLKKFGSKKMMMEVDTDNITISDLIINSKNINREKKGCEKLSTDELRICNQ